MVIWGVQPDAMAYNTMMKLCADTRQYERAILFMDDMDMEGLRPSRITIETLLKAAATAPQWIRVRELPTNVYPFSSLLEERMCSRGVKCGTFFRCLLFDYARNSKILLS